MKEKNPKNEPLNSFAKYSGIAIQMAVIIYLGSLLGQWLEGKYHTEDKIIEKGVTLAAIFIAIYSVIKQVTSNQN